jgi:hypothetical protein
VVNLQVDAVFSGSFSSNIEDKTTSTLGEFKVVFGAARLSKSIQTHGDWTIAWNATSAAIRFVYPHRAAELDQYTQYILWFFWCLSHFRGDQSYQP